MALTGATGWAARGACTHEAKRQTKTGHEKAAKRTGKRLGDSLGIRLGAKGSNALFYL